MKIFIGSVFFLVVEMLAFDVDAARPRSREVVGIVEAVNMQNKAVAVDGQRYVWTKGTRFIEDGQFTGPSGLNPGEEVRLNYRSPLVGEKFATKVRWSSKGEEFARQHNNAN